MSLLQPFKQSIILLRFEFVSNSLNITTNKGPVVWKGEEYKPEPAIAIELPESTGGLSEETAKITLPNNRSAINPELGLFVFALSSARAQPTVTVKVIELIISGNDISESYLYEGVLTKVRRNPGNKRSSIELELVDCLKGGLENVSMGRSCDPECGVLFGGVGCYVDSSQYFSAADAFPNQFAKIRRAHVIISLAPDNLREVRLTINPALHPLPLDQRIITVQPRGWWVKSYIEAFGISISILDWIFTDAGGSNRFILNKIPPLTWEQAQGALIIGCPQTRAACEDRNNEQFFAGLGYGIPAYNPTLEESDE